MEPTLKNGQIAHLFLHPLIANPLTPNRLREILGFILLLTFIPLFLILPLRPSPAAFTLSKLTPPTIHLFRNPLYTKRLGLPVIFILLLTLMASFRILLGGIPFFFYYGRHSFPKPKIPKTTAERAYDGLGSDITPMETKPKSHFWGNRVTLNVV